MLLSSLFTGLLILWFTAPCWAQAMDEAKKSRSQEARLGDQVDLTSNEFKNETRLGAIFSTGNTGSITVSGSNTLKYRIRRFENNIRAGAFYNRIQSTTTGAGTGTFARYIFGTYRLDYYFLSKTTVYGGGGGYTDEIKGIETAGQGFTGFTHYLIREKSRDLGGSVGYDLTVEDRVAPAVNETIHSATAGLIYRQDLNEVVSVHQKIDAQDNVSQGRDFRLQSQSDLKVNLNKHLALVLGVNLRFDNVPVAGFKKLDTLTDLSLVASF